MNNPPYNQNFENYHNYQSYLKNMKKYELLPVSYNDFLTYTNTSLNLPNAPTTPILPVAPSTPIKNRNISLYYEGLIQLILTCIRSLEMYSTRIFYMESIKKKLNGLINGNKYIDRRSQIYYNNIRQLIINLSNVHTILEFTLKKNKNKKRNIQMEFISSFYELQEIIKIIISEINVFHNPKLQTNINKIMPVVNDLGEHILNACIICVKYYRYNVIYKAPN